MRPFSLHDAYDCRAPRCTNIGAFANPRAPSHAVRQDRLCPEFSRHLPTTERTIAVCPFPHAQQWHGGTIDSSRVCPYPNSIAKVTVSPADNVCVGEGVILNSVVPGGPPET